MVWNRLYIFWIIFFISNSVFSQSAPFTYLVSFTDKLSSPFTVSNPLEFLSQRSIERKSRHGISIDENDLPVNPQYITAVDTLLNVQVVARSKWFNNITILISDTNVLSAVRAIPFVKNVRQSSGRKLINTEDKFQLNKGNAYFTISDLNYGLSANQIKMFNGQFLHELGFYGNDKLIAVIDNGFIQVDILPQYQHLFSSGKIIQGPDFVRRDGNVYNGSATHGTLVLSCMAAYEEGNIVGTAPAATYCLMISENDTSEFLVEEDYWIAAAEWADSAGVDVINTSLGYSTFDDPSMDHNYAQMDGNTTRITKGVDMAAKKGMISVNSAGNAGTSSWYYITAPADADSNLTVGAVGPDSVYAAFSSKGPSFDGRIKPDVAAQGFQDYLLWPDGNVALGNGTSFSSPLLAGMTACLWEAFPNKTNMEIISAIKQSANQYLNPDAFLGYGIPDFAKAYHILNNSFSENDLQVLVLNNPFFDSFGLNFYSGSENLVFTSLMDLSGKIISEQQFSIRPDEPETYYLDVKDKLLRNGVYILKMEYLGGQQTIKLVKQ